jgi:Tol biopolymer transport system component
VEPIWSPDGSRLAFRSDRSGPARIYVKALNSPDATPLTEGPMDQPSAWTPDGKELAFVRGTGSITNIYIVSLAEPNKVRPLLNTRFAERTPEFSPDGRWLAYGSNESGPAQIYVQPYPGPGKRLQVSTNGGVDPAWSRDGKELFFSNGVQMLSVHFKAEGTEFLPDKPDLLFEKQFARGQAVRGYDVTADGRFLVRQAIPNQTEERNKKVFPSTLRIVLNWTGELDRLLRTEKRAQ